MATRSEPESLLKMLKDISRRLHSLETGSSTGYSAIPDGGAVVTLDDSGNPVFRMGTLTNGSYGAERLVNGVWQEVVGGSYSTGGSALAGSFPAAGTTLITKYWNGVLNTNVNGDATMTFPGGAFANGLVSVQATEMGGSTSFTTGPAGYVWSPWNPSLSGVWLRCFATNSQTPIATGTLPVSIVAVGW